MTTTALAKRQKAAALVLAMGPQASAQVMAHLAPGEVEAIAREVAALGQVRREDVAGIVSEFLNDVAARRQTVAGGADPARALLRAWTGDSAGVEHVLEATDDQPFAFLRSHPAAQLATALGAEASQTIALVLSHLTAKHAAGVLSNLPVDRQHDVARRVATLAPVSRATVAAVESAVHELVGPPDHAALATGGGARDLAAMLNNLDRSLSDAIMTGIEADDAPLAEQIRNEMFVFEDLVSLGDRPLQEVLRAVEPAKLAVAMKGADAAVTDAIWRNLSERASTALQEEIELLGPTPRADIEAGRAAVVAAIRRLEAEGTITISRGGEDLVA